MEEKVATSERIMQGMSIRGISQADLAKATGLPKSAISQYANGKFEPKQRAIYAISQALNVSEAWLMGFNVPMERGAEVLSEEEHELIRLYRKLDENDRRETRRYISDFLLAKPKYLYE